MRAPTIPAPIHTSGTYRVEADLGDGYVLHESYHFGRFDFAHVTRKVEEVYYSLPRDEELRVLASRA